MRLCLIILIHLWSLRLCWMIMYHKLSKKPYYKSKSLWIYILNIRWTFHTGLNIKTTFLPDLLIQDLGWQGQDGSRGRWKNLPGTVEGGRKKGGGNWGHIKYFIPPLGQPSLHLHLYPWNASTNSQCSRIKGSKTSITVAPTSPNSQTSAQGGRE